MCNDLSLAGRLRIPAAAALAIVCALPLCGGCIELGLIPPPNGNGQNNGDDNGDGGANGNDPQEVPAVRMTASNLTPQANEELILRCELLNEPGGTLEYQFHAEGGGGQRFQVDPVSGTARFIVQEVDVGVAISVTCTAANALGVSQQSNAQVIVATPSTAPDPVFP